MAQENIFGIVKRNLWEILPDLDEVRIEPQKSMKELVANSIDRVDAIIGTMEALNLRFSPNELGAVENIQGLIDFCRGLGSW